ncbi:MAG: hypothetical protein AB8F94_01175 [Saprospiraceae bacterium]
MKKIKYIMLIFIIGCISSQIVEEISIIKEFKQKEKFKIWTTEKSYTKIDSMYSIRKSFTAFDSLNRAINKNNSIFYRYNSDNKIATEHSIYRRDRTVKIIDKEYKYDSNGNLELILMIGETVDTIQRFKYNENNQMLLSKTGFKEIDFKYENGNLSEKVSKEYNSNPRISNYIYDKEERLKIENWLFGDNHKMKTTFKYDEKNRLISEIDSSFVNRTNPNTFIEFRTDYKYNSNDSIIEKINLGRILSEIEFKNRGRITYEYEKN